jgi:dipeptidyl aminopeptidase/acylaminoacyl peptidase
MPFSPLLRGSWRAARLSILALALLALPAASPSLDDGRLLRAAPVSFDDASLAWLARIEPRARRIAEQVELSAITYASDGLEVHGYMAAPRGTDRLPCVIYNRGGNRSFGALDDAEALLSLGRIAMAGYVVVASQYRGHADGPGRDEFGGAELNDVLNLIPLLESMPQADASRIGMVGWSRGGMMTYLALTRTDRIAAAIVGSGVANLKDAALQRPEMEHVYRDLIPNYEKESEAQLAARSAVRWPDRMHKDTPILLLQGGADWRVDPLQTLALAEKLYATRHPFRLVFFEGGDHSLTEYRHEVQSLVDDWLERYVKRRRPWPSLLPHGS